MLAREKTMMIVILIDRDGLDGLCAFNLFAGLAPELSLRVIPSKSPSPARASHLMVHVTLTNACQLVQGIPGTG